MDQKNFYNDNEDTVSEGTEPDDRGIYKDVIFDKSTPEDVIKKQSQRLWYRYTYIGSAIALAIAVLIIVITLIVLFTNSNNRITMVNYSKFISVYTEPYDYRGSNNEVHITNKGMYNLKNFHIKFSITDSSANGEELTEIHEFNFEEFGMSEDFTFHSDNRHNHFIYTNVIEISGEIKYGT